MYNLNQKSSEGAGLGALAECPVGPEGCHVAGPQVPEDARGGGRATVEVPAGTGHNSQLQGGRHYQGTFGHHRHQL